MKDSTTINTIRHAHTDYNIEKRYAGTLDISLNERGIQESREAARQLLDHHFDVAISSTMKRSIETAEILIGQRAPILTSKLCCERNFGILEGLTWNDVQHLDPPVLLIEVGGDLHTVNPRGAEPLEDVWQRARKFRSYLFNHHAGKNILVVSHGVFLQMLHGLMRGISCIESLAHYPANLELYTFQFSGKQLVREASSKLIHSREVKW